jgi:hypothetical protein
MLVYYKIFIKLIKLGIEFVKEIKIIMFNYHYKIKFGFRKKII